jgi:hypothetical protein
VTFRQNGRRGYEYMSPSTLSRARSPCVLRYYVDEDGAQGFWYWEDEPQTRSSQPFLTSKDAVEAKDHKRLTWATIQTTLSTD